MPNTTPETPRSRRRPVNFQLDPATTRAMKKAAIDADLSHSAWGEAVILAALADPEWLARAIATARRKG